VRIENGVAYVPLTKGYEAIVDVADLPIVGAFNWHASVKTANDGQAGNVYARRKVAGSKGVFALSMHREILGDPAGVQIDHHDGNGLNNTRANLRLATQAENARNARRSRSNTSGLKGVTWHKGARKWMAQISVNGSQKYLGCYATLALAHAAYCSASAELHGHFGRTA